MKLYLVRHGESVGNVLGIHQNASTPLSEIGIDQARFVAHRFKNIPIDILYASDYIRTQQTAQEIAKVINKPIVSEPLLREIKRPTQVEGKVYGDPHSSAIYQQLDQHKFEPDWHYADEENYYDVFNRVSQFLQKLSTMEIKSCLAVTHGVFLRMCFCYIMYPDNLNLELFERSLFSFKTINTGITVCEYQQGRWQLVTFNDHAHLA